MVRVEIWTRNLDKDHIYSSSSALLPLISKKNRFLVNRHNLSHLCYVSDGEIHTTPTLCHPQEGGRLILFVVLFPVGTASPCSAATSLSLVFFLISSTIQPCPRDTGRLCLHLLHYPGSLLCCCAIRLGKNALKAVGTARVASPTPRD